MKRVLAINDISCYGKCSLTVALPILSALSVEVCPLPTCMLSAHTGIKGFCKYDLTDNMDSIYTHFKELKLEFDCVYSGYVPSINGAMLVQKILNENKDKILVVDPVMGDNGTPYSTHTNEICDSICALTHGATIITPNVTEASILLNKPYPTKITDIEMFYSWLTELGKFSKISIITGILINDDLYNICYDKEYNKFYTYSTKKIDTLVSGTGDLFTSCFTGCVLNDMSIEKSLELSSNFVYKSILQTKLLNKNTDDGIAFEPILKELF